MKEIVNAAEAARILKMPESYVRFYSPRWKDIAEVWKPKKNGNNKYDIKTRKLCARFNIPLEEAERRLAGNG